MAAQDKVAVWEPNNSDSPFHFGEHVVVSAWPRLWTLGDRTILGRLLWAFDTPSAEPMQALGARCFSSVQAIVDALREQAPVGGEALARGRGTREGANCFSVEVGGGA